MVFCPRCAVEMNDGTQACPLCGAQPVDTFVTPEHPYPLGPEVPLKIPRDNPALRQRIFITLTVCLGLPLLTVFFIDIVDGHLHWAPYAMVPLACLWCYSGLLLYWTSRPLRHYAALLLVTAGLLAGLDRCSGAWNWFPGLGLPILGTLALLLTPFMVLLKHRRLGWANTTGWGLIAIGMGCLIVDTVANRWRGEAAVPTWSLVVLISLLPAGMFMLYVHHRVRKHVDLEKWFHI
ncbi:DUF6320 domain-containing protein [Planctomycetota bacterium]